MNRFSQRMNRVSVTVKVLLRPAFAAFLAISQVTSRRGTIFTPDALVLTFGIPITIAGVWLWTAAARHLTRAVAAATLATTGPYRTIRHPIYTSMYLICTGMALAFFAWLWFVVLLAFAPLW